MDVMAINSETLVVVHVNQKASVSKLLAKSLLHLDI